MNGVFGWALVKGPSEFGSKDVEYDGDSVGGMLTKGAMVKGFSIIGTQLS